MEISKLTLIMQELFQGFEMDYFTAYIADNGVELLVVSDLFKDKDIDTRIKIVYNHFNNQDAEFVVSINLTVQALTYKEELGLASGMKVAV